MNYHHSTQSVGNIPSNKFSSVQQFDKINSNELKELKFELKTKDDSLRAKIETVRSLQDNIDG